MNNAATTLREKVHELADQLAEGATWRDVAYQAAVRADIEAGLADAFVDRVTSVDDILEELGITEK